jgi:hypothetical protein
LKNKALLALLISLIAIIPLKLFSNEEVQNSDCFTDILKTVNKEKTKGGYNFVISEDAKYLFLYARQANNKDDLNIKVSQNSLQKCSFESASDLYESYEEAFEKYIEQEALIFPPEKRKQDNGNIVIFQSSMKKVPLNSESGPPNEELEKEALFPKEIIDLDNRSDELIKATFDIIELFIKNELNQGDTQYKEAASALINMVKDKWKNIEDNGCEQKDYQTTLEKCQGKQNIISKFKNEDLPTLKHIQIFKNNKEKIKSCFNIEGFNEENCNTNKKIKSESLPKHFEKLISQNEENEKYFEDVFVGILESDFVYEEFELEIDTYVNNILVPFITKTKKDIQKEEDKKKQEQIDDQKKINDEKKQRKQEEFIELLGGQSKFDSLDLNIDKILSSAEDLIGADVSKADLEELKSLESQIRDLSDNIKDEIQFINSQDDIDEIITKIKNLKNYKKYKDVKQVKNIIKELNNEKEIRKKFINDLNSISSQLIKKVSAFEDKKQLLEDSNEQQEKLETNIQELNDVITSLKDDLETQSNSKFVYMSLFFISLLSLFGFTAFYIYKSQQNKSTADHTLRSSFNEQAKKIVNENKNLKQELEKYKSQLQSKEKITENVKEKSFKSRFDDEQPQVIEPKISPLNEMLSFYESVLRDPNKIDTFINKYQAIALDRQSRIISQGETILVKDNKGFSKSNFWMVLIDNRYILLPGRTLNINVSSLIADNYRYARDLLSGIFSYKLGNDFNMLQFAELEKNGDSYKVITEGSLSLPQT